MANPFEWAYRDEQYPHPNRIRLTPVDPDDNIYDFQREPGVGTPGTNLDAAFFDRLTTFVNDTYTDAEQGVAAAVELANTASAEARYAADRALDAIESNTLEYDDVLGRYTNASIERMLKSKADGLPYGVDVPMGSVTKCTKTGANAGIPDPVPGIIGRPSVDPYRNKGPFRFYEVNGGVDEDGVPFVTAFAGDGRFSRDGSNGDVWVLYPVLYYSYSSTGDTMSLSISDTRIAGMEQMPKATLPNGEVRPYMLTAKYAASKGPGNVMRSVSGAPVWSRTMSHNNAITYAATATTGYSAKSVADDWYAKTMWLIKYATKDTQSFMTGCTSYNLEKRVTVEEPSATRVILSNADANGLVVGSRLQIGRSAEKVDRNNASAFNVADSVKIVSITDYDANNKAVNLDLADPIDTTGCWVYTAPWGTGACDLVDGDGSPTNPTGGKEPFVLQGVEQSLGLYEVLGDVIVNSDGSTGSWPYVLNDTRLAATSRTADYVKCSTPLPSDTISTAHWPMAPVMSNGFIYGAGSGASSTTGLCDVTYTVTKSTVGDREVLGLGGLGNGANAGAWFCDARNALSGANWIIGSRLSGTGRSRG